MTMQGNTELSREGKSIKALRYLTTPGDGFDYRLGVKGIVKIEACDENGEMSHVPWVAIYVENPGSDHHRLYVRAPASAFTIFYE